MAETEMDHRVRSEMGLTGPHPANQRNRIEEIVTSRSGISREGTSTFSRLSSFVRGEEEEEEGRNVRKRKRRTRKKGGGRS